MNSQQTARQGQDVEQEGPIQTFKDAQKFMGDHRASTREHRQLDRYKVLVTGVIDRRAF